MSTRTIKLKSLTQVSLIVVESDVRTLGEFKALPEIQKHNFNWGQIKLIDRATKTSLDLDEALLPHIDCILIMAATKTNSGAYSYKEAKSKIKEFKANGGCVDFNYTQATTEKLNEFIENKITTKDTIQEEIEVETEELPKSRNYKLQYAIDLSKKAIDLLKKEDVEPIDNTTISDLEKEQKKLSKKF